MHHVDDARLARFAAPAWAAALAQVAAATAPTRWSPAGTARGNEVLAHLAARLDVPMAARRCRRLRAVPASPGG